MCGVGGRTCWTREHQGLGHHPPCVCLQSWACVSIFLGTGSPDRYHWALCRLYMARAYRAPWHVPLSCYVGLVCGSVLEGMGVCGQSRTLRLSFSFVELLQAEVELLSFRPLVLSALFSSSSFPFCSFPPCPLPAPLLALPLPSNNSSLFSLAWPRVYCVAQATLTFSILQLMSTRVIDVNHWRGDSTDLYLGTQDEPDLVLGLFSSDWAPVGWGLSSACPGTARTLCRQTGG